MCLHHSAQLMKHFILSYRCNMEAGISGHYLIQYTLAKHLSCFKYSADGNETPRTLVFLPGSIHLPHSFGNTPPVTPFSIPKAWLLGSIWISSTPGMGVWCNPQPFGIPHPFIQGDGFREEPTWALSETYREWAMLSLTAGVEPEGKSAAKPEKVEAKYGKRQLSSTWSRIWKQPGL